jgi:hypothetical protein
MLEMQFGHESDRHCAAVRIPKDGMQGAKPRSNGATPCISINQQSPYPLNYQQLAPSIRRYVNVGRSSRGAYSEELRTIDLWARCKRGPSARNRVSPKREEMVNAADLHEWS